MKQYLEETGCFTVDIARTKYTWRGEKWAATGKVSIPIPDDFPTAEDATSRPFKLKKESGRRQARRLP